MTKRRNKTGSSSYLSKEDQEIEKKDEQYRADLKELGYACEYELLGEMFGCDDDYALADAIDSYAPE